MNWKISLLIGMILVAFSVTSAMAVYGGNALKGEYLFKQDCTSCHSKDGKGGKLEGPQKTMKQWDRFFKRAKRKHPGTIFKKISRKNKKDINQYFFDNADDAITEEICG